MILNLSPLERGGGPPVDLFPNSDAQAVAQKYVIPVNYLLLAIVWLGCFRSCVFVGCFFQHGISKKKMKNDEFPTWDTIWFLESV